MDKILVVDDMRQNITLMSSYLQSSGYNVISSATGAAAIRSARLMKPSLIVLDLILPDTSGFDVCRILKQDPETRDIIILIVTAMDSKESRARAFRMGADDYLVKPFDKEIFLAKVKALSRIKDLTNELENQYAAIKEKNQQLELQLKMARRVQQALITRYNGDVGGVNVVSKYMPAIDIGGDYYEVCPICDDQTAVFMADVSGHGISAALLTSMVKLMFQGKAYLAKNPNELLSQMNKEFCKAFGESSVNVYVCAFIAVVDKQNKRVKCSNAGHALPLFISSDGINEIDISGVPLGLMDSSEYDTKTLEYKPDDALFFYTDGLSDCFYKDSPDEFLQNLSELLTEMSNEPPQEILKAITEHFYNFDENAEYENDDVSMLLCGLA